MLEIGLMSNHGKLSLKTKVIGLKNFPNDLSYIPLFL